MAKNAMNPKADDHLAKLKQWQNELTHMRRIALSCDLTEEIKWGQPCYVFEKTGENTEVGRQRAYSFNFSEPKQPATRAA